MYSTGVLSVLFFVGLCVQLGVAVDPDIIKTQFEAAFQGRCDHGSPCEQLCYELHDGMYECDCKEGYELHQDGYSCYELNATMSPTSYFNINNEEDILYQKDASFSAQLSVSLDMSNNSILEDDNSILTSDEQLLQYRLLVTTQTPNLEQKVPSKSSYPSRATQSLSSGSGHGHGGAEVTKSSNNYGTSTTVLTSTESQCLLNCGPGGVCSADDTAPGGHRCQCPLGKGGETCEKEVSVISPRFSGYSWLAFPALRAAYKHVQLTLELRPEAYDGIFFLTGERDDMAGDFMALLLHQGFVEFRFDCGSGVGVVRSEETVLLNQWNRLTLYRHRWDAWLQLNGGKHVKGRSKGLFSRITFREPLFIGGPGNTTGLSDKLPVSQGLHGCIRHLEVNDHAYRFALTPHGDATKGFGVQECTADRCSRVPCQHGGKCVTVGDSATCVCPLGFAGDLCETRVDLQVPAFNGSSYLRYRGLASSALTWLDLQITLKPGADNGVILYNGHRTDGSGDFMAVYMSDGHLEFAFDLGTGAGIVRSEHRVSLGEWHEIKISRTGRLAVLQVDAQQATEVWSPGAFTQLSLPQNLYIGGVPNFSVVSPSVRVRTSFIGCIQKVVINNCSLGILAEALGGANVDNCPHPCVARPCGEDATCVPNLDYFTCLCKPGYRNAICAQQIGTSESQIPQFSGINSFLHFSDSETLRRLSANRVDINIRFRISAGDGVLLWTERLSVGLERGAVVLRHRPIAGANVLIYNRTKVEDGLWHRLRVVWSEGGGSLEVDSAPVVTAGWAAPPRPPTVTGLFVGGVQDVRHATAGHYTGGIVGCVADLVLDDEYHVKLIAMSVIGRNVGRCSP